MGDDRNDDPASREGLFELLSATRTGDAQSNEELMRQLRTYLRVVAEYEMADNAKNRLGQSDVVQQSCIKVIEGLDQFRGTTEGEFRNWLKQVLHHEISQAARRMRTQKRDVTREVPLIVDGPSGPVERAIFDRFETPRTSALAAERQQALNAAIDRLPQDYQDVLKLRNWQRIPFAEIAKELGKSVNATEKLWFRAVRKLRQELSDFDETS